MARQRVSVVIVDVDNTLFDWIGPWHASFESTLQLVHRYTGISQSQLKAEFREVHRRHGTTEYADAIDELPSLGVLDRGVAAQLCQLARAASGDAWRSHLRLYPGIREALVAIKTAG